MIMLEDIVHRASYTTLTLSLFATCILTLWFRWLIEESKIRSLGAHAVRIKTRLPFDIDFVISGISHAKNHTHLQAWQDFLVVPSTGNKPRVPRFTVEGYPGGQRVIFTAEPENIKAILATQFDDYGKGEDFHTQWREFLGDSIFTTDSEQWRKSRSLIRPQFIKDRVSDLEVFERHVKVLIKEIRKAQDGDGAVVGKGRNGDGHDEIRMKREKTGGSVDVNDLFFRFTLDAATDFLLGRSVGSLENSQHEFAEAFEEVQRVQSIITRSGPLGAFYPRKSFHSALRKVNIFVNTYVEAALRLSPEVLASKTKAEEGYTFLHALASFTRDRQILRDQIMSVLLAGRDTTAGTLSWTFYELARHPDVWARLRKEVLERVGREKMPTYEDLKSLKFLQNTMQETLRLYPSVPFNLRLALKDTTLPTGGGLSGLLPIGVPEGTIVGYSTLVMQRRTDLYQSPHPHAHPLPSRAEEEEILNFDPERWSHWQPKPWTYIPFNGGPRICVGQQFALTEMGYTIVRLMQRFERLEDCMIIGQGKDEGLKMKSDIVLQPAGEVRVRFVEDQVMRFGGEE